MRTIRTKVYKFNELSKTAQEKAIYNCRDMFSEDISMVYDEAYYSVKKFNEIFCTEQGRKSWLDVRTDQIDDNILQLKGLRLYKYIWNNFKAQLFKGKSYSLWSKTEKSYKHYKDGFPVLKTRHSRIILENSCVLTGVCWDEDLLQPIYDLLNWKAEDYKSNDNIDFETLMDNCFYSLKSSLDKQEEYINSEEYTRQMLESNDYEFTQDGKMF